MKKKLFLVVCFQCKMPIFYRISKSNYFYPLKRHFYEWKWGKHTHTHKPPYLFLEEAEVESKIKRGR